jgi:hypothetical protein
MSKTDEMKAGLASVGIGWIEPQDRRNKAGRYMLDRGVRTGVPIDPGEVQTMLVEFCDIYVRDLELRVESYRKIAEDALNVKPTPSTVELGDPLWPRYQEYASMVPPKGEAQLTYSGWLRRLANRLIAERNTPAKAR